LLAIAALVVLSADAWLSVDASASSTATAELSGAPAPESATPEVGAARLRPGNIFQARIAVRRACRRFYDYGTQAQVDRECGQGPVGWRSDCYAPRPSHFVPRVGGCAYLRGYFAVYFLPAGAPSSPGPTLFRVGRTRWRVQPESD